MERSEAAAPPATPGSLGKSFSTVKEDAGHTNLDIQMG